MENSARSDNLIVGDLCKYSTREFVIEPPISQFLLLFAKPKSETKKLIPTKVLQFNMLTNDVIKIFIYILLNLINNQIFSHTKTYKFINGWGEIFFD